MRDLLITLLVIAALPMVLMQPWVGILVWSWLGYMNPHKLAYGFAQTLPLAQAVAIATIVGMIFSKEKMKIPWSREVIVLLVFVLWMLTTTFFALNQDSAWGQWDKIWKIQLMTLLTLVLITDKRRIHLLIWVIALSLGFYGVKGGIFTILTGGGYHVWGPEDTFIGGNNEMGLALIMTVPMMRYLQLHTEKKWVKMGLMGAMVLTMVAILGTQSRGALLGAIAMMLFLALKSQRRTLFLMLMAIVIPLILAIMPQSWWDRMASTANYEQDASAMGRINAWHFAFNLASDRVTGGGYEAFTGQWFSMYAPDPMRVHDAHSIYFEVLGEHGFVGLALFVLLLFLTWRCGTTIIQKSKLVENAEWAANLARMLQVSLIGYMVSGAFLGMAYFDLYYHLIAILVVCKVIVEKMVNDKVTIPAGKRFPGAKL